MKHMKWGHKRFGAIFLSLALLCGMFLGTIGWTLAAADKDVFSVDFSNLAALVDDDGGIFVDNVYKSAEDDTNINKWMDERFSMYYSRENDPSRSSVRTYLGEEKNAGHSGGHKSYWRITSDGKLQGGLATSAYADYVRTSESLTLKYEGKEVILDNFEATVVFSLPVNYRGAVYLSFNEQLPGRFGWRNDFNTASPINNDAVIVALPESITTSAGRAGVKVKGYGETFAANGAYDVLLNDAFNAVMELNADYELYVKVLDNDVSVKVTKVSGGAVLLEKTYADAVKGDVGTVSVGVAQSLRSIKSILVKELDENGNQVDFGTLMEKGLPKKFDVKFSELADLVDDSNYMDGLYTPASTDTTVNDWVLDKFDLKISREGHTFLGRTDLGTPYNNGAGNSYWSVSENGYLVSSEQGGGEPVRTVQTLTLKNEDGELAILDNFEAKIVFKNTTDTRGYVFVLFNEANPGKFGWRSDWGNVNQDGVFVGMTEHTNHHADYSGITVKGANEAFSPNCNDGYMYKTKESFAADKKLTAGASAVDHEMIVRVVGDDVYVKVSTPSTGAVLWEKTYAGAVKGETGSVSIGAGRGTRAIKSIEVKELDATGNQVDFGTLYEELHPSVTVDQFAVDFADLAALVPATSFADGLYTPAENDTAINEWAAERFDMYLSRENSAYAKRAYLGEPKSVNRPVNSFWQINADGYLQLSNPGGGEFIRSTEALTVKYDGKAAMMDNFEAKIVFKYTANIRSAVFVSFNEKTPGKLGWSGPDYLQQDIVMLATPEEKIAQAGQSGIAISGMGEPFSTAVGDFGGINTDAQTPFSSALTVGNDYELTVKVVGKDVTVTVKDKTTNSIVLAQKTYQNAANGESGYISVGAGHSARAIKSIVITELDKNGQPVDFGTLSAEMARPEYFKADFSELAALVADNAFANNEYTPAENDTAINEWISERFDGYYNRECRVYTPRTWLGDKLDTGNASYPSYWSITKGGALKSSIPGWLGGEYPRTTESLNVKYDGAAVKLDNFMAKVVFSSITERGAVYVSFNEAAPGKFGWTLNPTNNQDDSYILQDAVLIGTPENMTHPSNFSGVTVKGYGETFNAYAMEDDKFTLTPDTDYELTVTVIDNDVAVKLKKVSDGTVLLDKTYTDQVLGTNGYVSIGAGQASRSIKYIEVVELDENGKEVPFGTFASTQYESDGLYVDFRSLAAVVDSADYVNGMYQSKEDDTDINAWIDDHFGLYYSRESWGFYDRAYLGQLSEALDGGDGWGGNHYWEINKLGYLQHTTEKIGGEYLRKGDALYVKHNDLAHEMKNLEATLEFNTLANGKGSVYIAFHEAQAGKFGWYANPTNSADTSPMMQDAVILGVDGEGDTGIIVKKRGVAISGTDMGEDTFTMSANTDYKLHIRVVGKNVDVTVTKGTTEVFKKTYENAVSAETGYVSFGTTNASRAFKSIEVVQLNDAGDVVEFGTSLLEPVNPNDTVRYTYNSAADLDAFTSYFMPVPGVDADAVRTEGTENDNWYIKNGAMLYKTNSLHKSPDDIQAVNGNVWNSNMAIAMLETQKYKNFILDVDFYVSGRWAVFGFGAKGGTDGAFSSQKNGGYTVHIEASGGKGEIKLTGWDPTAGQSKMLSNIFVSPYSGSGKHHMRLIVKQGVVTVYLDDVAPVTFTLPTSYESGYVYLGSNNEVTYFDNLTVLDLDKGPFEITSIKSGLLDTVVINRDQGDMMDLDAMPSFVTGYDANGYAYTFPAKWLNSDYRSYKDGNFDFKLVPGLAEFEIADSLNATKKVINNINNAFDTDTTVKYYFDHENDLLDFVTGYDDTSKGGHSTTDDDRYVIASSPLERWKLTGNGAVTNNYKSVGYGHNGTTMGWDVSTLIQKELNLTNFRLELDFTHGENFWYPYVITGMQDFTDYAGDNGGVYFFVEQEGRPNIMRNLRNGNRQYTTPITEDNTFFVRYDRSTSVKHHVTIEVVDGVLTFWVDNSDGFPHYLSDTALGGFMGIAGMGNGATFSNITITALDDDGNEVPLATADRSMASDVVGYEDIFVGWKPSSEDWAFEWNKNYIFKF